MNNSKKYSGKVYGFGCDTVGQLGLGIKDDDDDKIVPVPRQITSAHLDGFRVISVSMADNHSVNLYLILTKLCSYILALPRIFHREENSG